MWFTGKSCTMEDGFGFLFDQDFKLDSSQLRSQSGNRLSQHSEFVFQFLASAGRKGTEKKEVEKKEESTGNGSKIDHSEEDALAYVFFEKLWTSSKYHKTCLHSQWISLNKKIEKQGPDINTFQLGTVHVSGVLYLCEILKTNFIVRFRAVELYNRYLKLFTKKHEDYLSSCSEKEREEFYSRFESQTLLRMCTCILIASKLHADSQIRCVTTDQIRNLLAMEGLKFSRTNIAHSELRVLETLDYRCLWATPLDLLEQLLSILDLPVASLKHVHYYSILLLEYCYSDLDNLRDKFLINIKKSQRFTTSKGKITMPLKCAAIVSAALFIVSAETKTNLHKMVAKIAELNEEDVHSLAILMLDSLNFS